MLSTNIGPYAAEMIYKVTIESTICYCSIVCFLEFLTLQFPKFNKCAFKIVYKKNETVNRWCPIINVIKQHCAQEVFKCLNGLAPKVFSDTFEIISHQKETRGNNSKLRLPKVKSESGRKFSFQGALVFNDLPSELMKEISLLNFRQKCKSFFMDYIRTKI